MFILLKVGFQREVRVGVFVIFKDVSKMPWTVNVILIRRAVAALLQVHVYVEQLTN